MAFREDVIRAMREFPEKSALDFKVVNSEDKGGYTLQTVEYNVEQRERVRAFILLPETLGEKNPAILALHQHNLQYHFGKSEVIGQAGNSMYAYGLELCRRGYVVLAPDHLCFEQRILPHFRDMPDGDRSYEMFEFAKRINNGSSLRAKYLHDLTVAVDALESLPRVDKDRIGVIGHSLGGQEAAWLMWYDRRIAACVSSCGISLVDAIFRDNLLLALSLYIPGFAKLGDMCDIISEIAPRPFFMANGGSDILFPIDGVRRIIEKAKARYAEIGRPENFCAKIFDGGHMFPDDVKQEAYSWLDTYLRGK